MARIPHPIHNEAPVQILGIHPCNLDCLLPHDISLLLCFPFHPHTDSSRHGIRTLTRTRCLHLRVSEHCDTGHRRTRTVESCRNLRSLPLRSLHTGCHGLFHSRMGIPDSHTNYPRHSQRRLYLYLRHSRCLPIIYYSGLSPSVVILCVYKTRFHKLSEDVKFVIIWYSIRCVD